MVCNLSCEANFKTNYAKSCKCHWDFTHFGTYSKLSEVLFDSSNIFMWYKHENYEDYLHAV